MPGWELASACCLPGHPDGLVTCKASRVSTQPLPSAARDLADVPAVEVITTAAVHLMSAAAVKCGLVDPADLADAVGDDGAALTPGDLMDLAEARSLITSLAGLVTSAAPEIGSQHARALRDGLRSLQLAFREASVVPDAPGQGPGEKLTGAVR